jgi:hypothetical protein
MPIYIKYQNANIKTTMQNSKMTSRPRLVSEDLSVTCQGKNHIFEFLFVILHFAV